MASNTINKETVETIIQNENAQTTNNEVEAPTEEAGSSREEAIVVPNNEESDEGKSHM